MEKSAMLWHERGGSNSHANRLLARQQVVATLCLENETIEMKSRQTPQCCKRVLFKQSDGSHGSVLRLSEGDVLCCILNVYTPFWDTKKKSYVLSKVYVYIPNCAYSCWRRLSSSFCPFPPIKALNKVGVTNKYIVFDPLFRTWIWSID